MRTLMIRLCLVLAGYGCNSANKPSRFVPIATEFFSAASVGDSARLARLAADTLVYRDLKVLVNEEPTILVDAARGLQLQRGGQVSRDSAYLVFKPKSGGNSRGLDLGFVRNENGWQVYYAGLTGSDLRPMTGTQP